MKKNNTKKRALLAVILSALLLASCARTNPAKISDNSGVGRNPELIDGSTPTLPRQTVLRRQITHLTPLLWKIPMLLVLPHGR